VTEDYKLKLTNLHVSHTLGSVGDCREHLKRETRLIDERVESEMG